MPSPDQVEPLIQGATPVQIALLIAFGVIIAIGLYFVIEKMINNRIKGLEQLPDKIADLKDSITDGQFEIQKNIGNLEKKLWGEQEIKNMIDVEIHRFADHFNCGNCLNFHPRTKE